MFHGASISSVSVDYKLASEGKVSFCFPPDLCSWIFFPFSVSFILHFAVGFLNCSCHPGVFCPQDGTNWVLCAHGLGVLTDELTFWLIASQSSNCIGELPDVLRTLSSSPGGQTWGATFLLLCYLEIRIRECPDLKCSLYLQPPWLLPHDSHSIQS